MTSEFFNYSDQFNHLMSYQLHGNIIALIDIVKDNKSVMYDVEIALRNTLEKHKIDLDQIALKIEKDEFDKFADCWKIRQLANKGNRYAMYIKDIICV